MILAYVSLQAEKKTSCCWTASWLLLECLMMKSSMVFEREAFPPLRQHHVYHTSFMCSQAFPTFHSLLYYTEHKPENNNNNKKSGEGLGTRLVHNCTFVIAGLPWNQFLLGCAKTDRKGLGNLTTRMTSHRA